MIKGMTPEQIAELKDKAEDTLAHVGLSGPIGEQIDCLQCGLPLNVQRDGNAWNAECRCGWSAAGSSPRPVN